MFDWNSYYNLADELAKNSNEEHKRTAISRAYYSTFHNAKSYLDHKNFSYSGRDSVHIKVWNTYSRLDRECKKISVKGDRLKIKRQKVDYDKEIKNLNNLTNAAIQEAKDINEAIKKLY